MLRAIPIQFARRYLFEGFMRFATTLFAAVFVSLGLITPVRAQGSSSAKSLGIPGQNSPASEVGSPTQASLQNSSLPPAPSQALLSRAGGSVVTASARPPAPRIINGRPYLKPN